MLCQTKLPRSCAPAAERADADGRPIVFEVGADRFAIDYAITELNQKTGAQRCGLPVPSLHHHEEEDVAPIPAAEPADPPAIDAIP